MAGKSRLLIVDTDLGFDDAVAFHILLRPQASLELVAVTTVTGNVHVDQATKNAAVILRQLKKDDVPLYKGSGVPLMGKLQVPLFPGHGKDGLGDVGLSEKSSECVPPRAQHAAQALTELVRERPGQLEILALGPLTNIALAIRLDPSFARNVKHLALMGGCESARGNAGLVAEFNFLADPEAAFIVFDAFTKESLSSSASEAKPALDPWSPRITMVPWECCLKHCFSWSFFDTLTPPASTTANAVFLKQMCTAYERHERSQAADAPSNESFCPCDAYAAASLDRPAVVAASRDLFATVEVAGNLARGLVAFDWMTGRTPNVRVVQGLHEGPLKDLFVETFT